MNISLQSMALSLPHVASHPNRVPFRGVLTFIDTPSDKPPSGARGHRVMLTRAAAEQALPSLLGMAIDYAPSLDRHDARRKIGVITTADIVDVGTGLCPVHAGAPHNAPFVVWGSGRTHNNKVALASRPAASGASSPASSELGTRNSELVVAGFLYAKDFPEIVNELRSGGRTIHGMSYEIADAHIADLTATIWEVTQFTFTGAALLRRDKAAYRNTWIELAAAEHRPTTQPRA